MMSHRRDRSLKIILLGAAATQLFGMSGSVSIFFVSRTAEGLGAAAGVPPLLAHLTDVTEGDASLRARVMSYFELSLLAGLALGALTGLSARWSTALAPTLGAFRAVPSLAWVPLLILWLKIGETSKVTLIAMSGRARVSFTSMPTRTLTVAFSRLAVGTMAMTAPGMRQSG